MLRNEIQNAQQTVKTDRVQITIGEIATMYKLGELNISPDFQRLFRWPNEKKSKLVESILVGIPIPSIFTYEMEDGTWELIDGLQRVSTMLEFMGILKNPDTGEPMRSVLSSTKYLRALDGVVWKSESDGEKSLDKAQQLFFRRHRVDCQVLKFPSDPLTKFDLFQRLNRGGTYANEQEIRTCAMVLANAHFTQKLRDFVKQEDFQDIFRVTEKQRQEQKDLEYAVRLLVHSYAELKQGRDVQQFLDEEIERIIRNKDAEECEKCMDRISWSVSMLHRIFGADALLPGESAGGKRQFSLKALEGVAVGIARNKQFIIESSDPLRFLQDKVREFWKQKTVVNMSSPGVRGTTRIRAIVPFGDDWFKPK